MEDFILITIQTGCTTSLPCSVNDIKDFTINHCDFLFLDCSGCKLIQCSQCTQTHETIELERNYCCICFDHKENCYWGISECEPQLLYRLDACFCVLGSIAITGAFQEPVRGICCDNCENGIWIYYPCQLAFVEKCSGNVTWYKNEDKRTTNLGVLMQCACKVSCCYEGSRQIIEILSSCFRESIDLCIPKGYKIVSMASCPCASEDSHCRFCLLLSNLCSHEYVLTEYCIDVSQKQVEPCRHCSTMSDPCPPPWPSDPHCGGSYEVMHSIALEEAGISRILNAEGKKIQKAVAISDNIEDLICVNESVKRTLTQVTLLEGMLYSKLEALVRCDDFCQGTKPPNPLPCPPCHTCDDCHASGFCS